MSTLCPHACAEVINVITCDGRNIVVRSRVVRCACCFPVAHGAHCRAFCAATTKPSTSSWTNATSACTTRTRVLTASRSGCTSFAATMCTSIGARVRCSQLAAFRVSQRRCGRGRRRQGSHGRLVKGSSGAFETCRALTMSQSKLFD